jgi:hypothetical protein
MNPGIDLRNISMYLHLRGPSNFPGSLLNLCNYNGDFNKLFIKPETILYPCEAALPALNKCKFEY